MKEPLLTSLPHTSFRRTAKLLAIATLGVCASAWGIEGPVFNVQVDSTQILYTATPASSNVPGFKPHINFPWLIKRGDGSMVTWWSVGQTHGVGQFGLGAVSTDSGSTWSAPSTTVPFVPPITQMLPPGNFSRGFHIDHYDSNGFTSWTQGRFLSTNGGVTWTSNTATFNTGGVTYVGMYQNPGAVISDGSLLLINAFGQRPGESTFETVLFSSTNGGQNWTRRATVATHLPGIAANMGEEGPNESDIIQLNNGNLLAVFRTGQPFPNSDVDAITPSIFSSISTDKGLTWSAPKMLGVMGAYPHLNKLEDGSVAMTYGRYGAKIMFADETGTRWSFPTTILGESSSGYVRMEPRADGKYTYIYDHSSFYPPSWDANPPPGYIYANDQMAHMKVATLTLTNQTPQDDYHWSLQYHGDVSPNQAGQGWIEAKAGPVAGYLWGDLGQDYFRSDTGASGSNYSYYSYLNGANNNAWTGMEFSEGVVIDIRARAGSGATAESAADIFAGDGVNGYAVLQLTGSAVILEGQGGNASQASYSPPGFDPTDWHHYRLVIEPDASAGGQIKAKVFLDGNYDTPILVKTLDPTLVDELRFGDETGVNNGIFDLDFIRFSAINGQWGVNASGDWSGFDNWTTAIPSGVDRQANFLGAIQSARTITVDSPRTVGHIKFDNANRYTLGGSGTITLAVSGGKADINLAGGNHSILAPMVFASNTDITGTGALTSGDITNNANLSIQTNLTGGKLDGSGSTSLQTGKSATFSRIRQNALTVQGSLAIAAGRSTDRTSIVKSLTITGGSLDLADNDLIVNYDGGSPFTTVRSQILNGTVFSSVANADPKMALGHADTAVLGAGSFSGQSVDGTSVLVRYTARGDANVDGSVNSTDFTRFIAGYGMMSGAVWSDGDFNGDNQVDILDFNFLAGNFGMVIASPALGAVVPEPAALILAPMGLYLLRRRRV